MNKDKLDKQLQKMFREIPLENPSPEFLNQVMLLVEKEAERKKKRQKWIPFLQVAAGIVCIFLLPQVAIYLCTQFIPGFSLSFAFPQIDISISLPILSIALAILFLLVLDNLLHNYLLKKKIIKMSV